jgi:hypothetical protein
MSGNSQKPWLPLIPQAIAAFSQPGTLGRLLLVQIVVGLIVGATVAMFLYWECYPTLGVAIERLPEEGEIRSTQLDWRGESPGMIAEGRFLALTVDLDHSGGLRSPAYVQVEFGKTDLRMRSLFGVMDLNYPKGWVIAVNRAQLKPLWGAWEAPILALAVFASALWLLLSWWGLGAIHAPIAWIAGVFTNHEQNVFRMWKLSAAALMPGALLMAAGILAFNFGLMDLVGLLFTFCIHFVVGWVYLFLSLMFVPKPGGASEKKKNPFQKKEEK